MINELTFIFTLLSALGAGLIAGTFFAFSICVMKALFRLPPPHGIAAMQAINVVILNPWFLVVFFGTAATCLLLAGWSLFMWHEPGAAWRLAGSGLYLVGVIVVTIVCNVPRNDALAAVDADGAEGAALWAKYVPAWTAWNHVRTVAAFAAAAVLTLSLR
ncbi:MAG: DUF1772 domain-containing protein [Opitutaceae bacterium]